MRRDSTTILLVEDDPNDVFFLRYAFEQASIKDPILAVQDGQEAIDYLLGKGKYENRSKYPLPGLILLDLKVPRIRGLKVLEWIRGQPEIRETPVVVVTTSIEPADRRRADQLGVLAYLCKPVSAEGLLELIDLVPWLHLARG